MQMEMRNKYSCLLCATAVSKMSGLDHETKPRKGGAPREKEGERVAYLSILVSFLGGRAHGSSLAAPLGWGRGKCAVILAERIRSGSQGGGPARVAPSGSAFVRGPGLLVLWALMALPTTPVALLPVPCTPLGCRRLRGPLRFG